MVIVTVYSCVAAEQSVWGTAKTGIVSQYLGRIGSVFDESPSSVTEVTMGYKDFYAGVWSATTISDEKYGTTYGDEVDVYMGWTRAIGPIKLDISSSYYAIAQLDRVRDDLWCIESEITLHQFPFVQPYVRARYMGEVGSQSPQGGMFYFGGLRKTVTLGTNHLDRSYSLHLEGSTAYAGGALRDVTGFVYGRFTTTLDIPLGKQWTLSPMLIYQVASPEQRSNPRGFTDGNKWVAGLTLAYNF